MRKSVPKIKSIVAGSFSICIALAFIATLPTQEVVAQGNGCNTAVGSKSSPSGNGYGITGACFNNNSLYRHSSTTQAYGTYTIRISLSSSDSYSCNARAVDSGYVYGSSVVRATDYRSVLTCSHPPGYSGTGVHWINGTQFQSLST